MHAERKSHIRWAPVDMACLNSSLAFGAVSAQMRRLIGNFGSAQTQDALVAQDFDAVSEAGDSEACVAYRKAKKAKSNSGDSGGRSSVSYSGKGKVKNAPNYRTGRTNRRFICKSEYHSAPQRPRKGGKSGAPSLSN